MWKIEIPGFETMEDALTFRRAFLASDFNAVVVSDPPLEGPPISDDVTLLLAGLDVGSLGELIWLVERGRDPFGSGPDPRWLPGYGEAMRDVG